MEFSARDIGSPNRRQQFVSFLVYVIWRRVLFNNGMELPARDGLLKTSEILSFHQIGIAANCRDAGIPPDVLIGRRRSNPMKTVPN